MHDDSDEENDTHERRHHARRDNSLTKWVVAVVSSAVIAVSAFLAMENFRQVQVQLTEHQTRIQSLEIQNATLRESQRRIDETLVRLEQNDSIVNQKLDRLLERQRQ